jgi:hypothetical protein
VLNPRTGRAAARGASPVATVRRLCEVPSSRL